MTSRVYFRIVTAAAFAVACGADIAHADDSPPQLPGTLTLDDALAIFRTHGLDLLIADAAITSADGDVTIADAIPNPALTLGFGRSTYFSCGVPGGCPAPPSLYSIQISDQAAIEDTLSGKRKLRVDVASAARRAAKLSREDAERTLAFPVKSQFEQVLVAQLALQFANDTAAANATLLDKTREQAKAGKIGDADVLRVKTAKLESDQAVDQADAALRKARAQLAYVLGVRTAVPEFTVHAPDLERYALPPKLASATRDSLLARAMASRPDLHAQEAQLASAEAQLRLQRRERFPDIALSVGYSQQGVDFTNSPTPPTIAVSLSAPIPVLYQQQGEIRKAEAAVRTQRLQVEKLRATIVNDVASAYADFRGSQALVQRMVTGELLDSARDAKDAVLKAKELGAANLLDVLTAVATYIATNVEYNNDVASYWISVFELEQAIGSDLR